MAAVRSHLIVGIGGSAGGLYAYMALLDSLPDHTGMSFVIISHILPSSTHSLLAKLLATHTKMPVSVASEEMPIEPNHVYVIPPNADLRVENYSFKVSSPRTMNKQVNIFLTSLSEAMGHRAIGVIVSGYDGDGSEGCMQIKSRGGTTFAQDSSSTVPGMPLSAQNRGGVDFVLPVERIGRELNRIGSRSKARDHTAVAPSHFREP